MKSKLCSICFDETVSDPCSICADSARDESLIAVFAQPFDTMLLKRSSYKGRHYVLHGVISPREGIGPDQLRIRELVERVRQNTIRELTFWLPKTMEGNATSQFIWIELDKAGLIRPTRAVSSINDLPITTDFKWNN